jgi:TRAP-type C4-dicarboxylate transport system permease small subunit
MTAKDIVHSMSRWFDSVTGVLNWIGYLSLTGLVLLTSADVVGRYCFNSPVLGTVEVTELSMTILAGFAMLYTTTQRMHISVDLFFVRFPKRMQIIVDSLGSFLGFAIWGVIAWQVYTLGMRMFKTGDVSNLLHIPVAPFQFTLALGLTLHGLTLLFQGIRPLITKESEKLEGGPTL